jgi:hypothetical protein
MYSLLLGHPRFRRRETTVLLLVMFVSGAFRFYAKRNFLDRSYTFFVPDENMSYEDPPGSREDR